MARSRQAIPPIAVIFGDDEFAKSVAARRILDTLLPPDVDRALALCEYDGSQKPDQGGPELAGVLDDLSTLPFLAQRRVVLVRDADAFISVHREKLERYLDKPSSVGTLVLVARSFSASTRLYKAAAPIGELVKCEKLKGRAVLDFIRAQARALGKSIEPPAAARVADLIGSESGMLASEVEKLAVYVGERPAITDADVAALVGQSRQEAIFEAMELAAVGSMQAALETWQNVLETSPAAVFMAVGGIASMLRKWLTAHRLQAEGLKLSAIAPKLYMWGEEEKLRTILQRQPPQRVSRALAALADLDSQVKVGARSIESGVERILLALAASAA